MLESLFNKVAGLKAWNVIKKRLLHRWFPVNIATFLRTLIKSIPVVVNRLVMAGSKTRKSQKFFPSFFNLSFRFLLSDEIGNSDMKKLGIIFPRFPRLPRFSGFWFATFSFFKIFFHFFNINFEISILYL